MNEFKENIFNKKHIEEKSDNITEDYYLEMDLEEKKELKKELEKRKNNLGKIDFDFCFTGNESLEEALQNQDIFTGEDIISKAIKQGDITVDQLFDYFVFTKRPKNKFVVIESLLGFSGDKDQEKINDFLIKTASFYKENEEDYAFAKGSKLERFYLQGYCEGRLPYTNSNARTIKYAALNSLVRLNDKPEVAGSIFQKYREIIDLTKAHKDQIRILFKEKKDISGEELNKLTENILKKANHLLLAYSKKNKDNEKIDEKEIIQELEDYKEDQILCASVIRSLKDVELEDLRGVNFSKTTIEQLTAKKETTEIMELAKEKNLEIPDSSFGGETKKISEMIEIYKKNYSHNTILQKKLINGFVDLIKSKNSNTALYFYTKEDEQGEEKILTFNRFDKVSKKKRYFGSFNSKPSLAGAAIGHALLKASFIEEEKKALADNVSKEELEIEADSEPEKEISSNYIENYNFVVKKLIKNYGETGITAFNIIRKEENKKYYYRDYSREDVIKEYESEFQGNRYKIGEKFIILKFSDSDGGLLDKKENLSSMLEETAFLVNKHSYVMTRYFFTEKQKEVYCVLEKN